jgi:hypothetical protein
MPKVDMPSVNAVAKRIYKINKTFKNVSKKKELQNVIYVK